MAKHALVLGINEYPNLGELARLKYCVRDAKAISKKLKKKFGFDVHRLLESSETTGRGIRRAVDELIDRVAQDTDPAAEKVVVIFYAGHGARFPGDAGLDRFESIVPSDSGRGRSPVTDIFDWDIDGWLRRLERQTDNVTLILDSCHSGGAARVRGQRGDRSVREAPPIPAQAFVAGKIEVPPERAGAREVVRGSSGWLPASGRRAIVLAACGEGELAGETKKKRHGVFTYFLLKELDELDLESTTWGDLAARISHRVREDEEQSRQFPQIDGDGDRLVFGHRRAARQPSLAVLPKSDGSFELSGGALDGVAPESRWLIRSAEARHREDGRLLDTVAVSAVGLSIARIAGARLDVGQRAFSVVEQVPVSRADRLRRLRNPNGSSAFQRHVDHGRFRFSWQPPAEDGLVMGRLALGGDSEEVADGSASVELAEETRVDFEIVKSRRRRMFVNVLQVADDGEVGLLWPRTDHVDFLPGGVDASGLSTQSWSSYLRRDPDLGDELGDAGVGMPLRWFPEDPQALDLVVVLSEEQVDLGFLERPDESERGLPDREGDWAVLHARIEPKSGRLREVEFTAAPEPPDDFKDLVLPSPDLTSDGDSPVVVAASDAKSLVSVPADLAFRSRLEAAQRAALISPLSAGGGLLHRKHSAEKRMRRLGQDLFEVLLGANGFDRLWQQEGRRHGFRLRLALDEELAVLPWEFLHVNVGETDSSLGLDAAATIVRTLPGRPDVPEPGTVDGTFRVLGMIAQPDDQPRLDGERERRLMATAVAHLSGRLELVWVPGNTREALANALADGPWHAFHFIGHGDFDGQATISLAKGNHLTDPVSASDLADLLAPEDPTVPTSIRLVVLNACKGARASASERFASFGPVLENRGIPAVVAMQNEISDRAAIHFSATLYEGFAAGLAIDAAVSRARRAIAEDLMPTVEWGTPVLQMSSKEGRLLDLDLNRELFRRPPIDPPDSKGRRRRLRVGGRPRSRSGAPPESLWKKVKEWWVDEMLAATSIDPVIAAERWLERPGKTEELPPDQPLGTLASDGLASDGEAPKALLIVGPPGTGKTLTLFEVAHDLLGDVYEVERPIPVVFDLSEWRRPDQPLIDWLVARMSRHYGVPSSQSCVWFEQRHLAVCLDGLDEVGSEESVATARRRRSECVAAINGFLDAFRPPTLVVSCGLAEYLELEGRLSIDHVVRLENLTRERVLSAVGAGDGRGLLERLVRRNPGLQVQVRTPLWLSWLRLISPRLTATDSRLPRLDTADEIRDYLLREYVDHCFESARVER